MLVHFFRVILKWLFRVRVEGDATQLKLDRVLLVANHDSILDGALLGLFLPSPVTVTVAGQDLRHPLVRLIMRAVPHVVLDTRQPLALKRLIRLVERGQPVLVFPQGPATPTGSMTKVYDSAAVIAARCNARIVPVRIAGTLHSRFAVVGGRFPRRFFPQVTIRIMPGRTLPALPQSLGRTRRRRLADALLEIMQHMMYASQPVTTLFEALLDAAAQHGRRTRILEDTQRHHSYGDLIKAGLALGRLGSRHADEEEIVGVLMPNNQLRVIYPDIPDNYRTRVIEITTAYTFPLGR